MMVKVRDDISGNAIGMLSGKNSIFLGWVGDLRYYMVDGKLWVRWPSGSVYRSDDDAESTAMAAQVRELVRLAERRATA